MENRTFTAPTTASDVATSFMAIELSSLSWLVAMQMPLSASVRRHKLAAGDTTRLLKLVARARASGAGRVVCCFEAGRDGFWLHRVLSAEGVVCLVLDPASLPVDRRARRAKSDRLDVGDLLRAVIAYDGGDERACRPVRVPTVTEEDARRVHRERGALIKERVRHVNRIKAHLALHGVSGFEPLRRGERATLPGLVGGDGAPLPPALLAALEREFDRLALVLEQIAAVEAVRDAVVTAPAAGDMAAAKVAQLARLKSIGTQTATVLTREVFYRDFDNRRQVGSYVGLTPSPWRSGGIVREQGISKAGNPRVRTAMIELAWLWLRWQPGSALSQWFRARVGAAKGRVRRIAIVALARKLLIALWRFVETGLVPEGAVFKS
jgi:transposase